MSDALTLQQIEPAVSEIVRAQPVVDMHTHLYPPSFGTPLAGVGRQTDPQGLMLFGIDALLTYHYLVAEVFRVVPSRVLSYDAFFRMPQPQQAEHVWKHLFVERTPISEACRGVVTTLTKLGIDPNTPDLASIRRYFQQQDASAFVDRVMQAANVASITMTNNPFDPNERDRWLRDPSVGKDPRFAAVLRIDPMVVDWPAAAREMSAQGYRCGLESDATTLDAARRFLRDWAQRMGAIYIAMSLPPTFRYPAEADDQTLRAGEAMLEQAILPVCQELNLPLAMMIGATRQLNPGLRDAGDFLGVSDVLAVANLCRRFPKNRFFVTMLARENQHALCVAARKFDNLMPFGCWWFLNNPSLIEEITRMRLELLGTSFIPQHSDARVLDQLIYKWDHSRQILIRVLAGKYTDLARSGWTVGRSMIQRDARQFLAANFAQFLKG